MNDEECEAHVVGSILAQIYSLRKGKELFCQMTEQTSITELSQINDFETYWPLHKHELSKQDRRDITGVSDMPRGTLRSSQIRHLSKHFYDRVLFDYVSFIRLPYEIKTFVSIISVISIVESIANSLKVRFWKLFFAMRMMNKVIKRWHPSPLGP